MYPRIDLRICFSNKDHLDWKFIKEIDFSCFIDWKVEKHYDKKTNMRLRDDELHENSSLDHENCLYQ